jgi:iron complex outermembrane receptor protein
MAQDTLSTDGAAGDDEQIIVTAQRRSENLMTTAVSASVISGKTLEEKGVVNIDALQFATPSVVVNNFGQGNDFNVRGIGKAEHNTQTTTGVITYRDGVPTFPGYVQGEPYYDLANIQVLRGPQGTIVGQNATGGAIFVNTVDPIINGGTTGYVQVQAGNYSDFGGQFAVNLPLGDTFAARISGYAERRGGFFDITNDGDPYAGNNGDLRMYAGRLSLLWQPTDQLSVLSKTDVGHLDFGAYPASPYWTQFENFPFGSATPNPYASDLFDITANTPMTARDKFVRSIFKIDYEFEGGVKFRSVSSYQKANTTYSTDLDGTDSTFLYPSANPPVIRDWYFFDDVNERQITQEINLISPDDQRFTWLLGASALWNKYYFKEPYQFIIDTNYPLPDTNAFKPFFVYVLQGTNPTRSLAVFGQLGFAITDDLKIEVGGRYTDSRSTNHVDVIQYGTPILAEQTTTSDNFSYKVSLGYEASDDHYLYAFVATGFRPGGLNVPVGLGLPAPFKQEEVTSFEAGWKANLADGNIRTTVNGFYNDYKNFQVIIGYPTFPTFGIELNVEDKTKIYGFEAEAEFHFGNFSLDVGMNVLHSSLGEFYATDPRAASVQACDPLTGPGGGTCIALEGREQTYAPNFTFNIGAQYVFELGEDDTITPRVNFGHIAEQWATLFENESRGDLIEARNILNAQLEWRHDTLAVTAYATNLTNQHYPGALNSGLYFAGPPRQYGVKILKTF